LRPAEHIDQAGVFLALGIRLNEKLSLERSRHAFEFHRLVNVGLDPGAEFRRAQLAGIQLGDLDRVAGILRGEQDEIVVAAAGEGMNAQPDPAGGKILLPHVERRAAFLEREAGLEKTPGPQPEGFLSQARVAQN